MGYKGKSNKEYQREYYYKNREQRLLKIRQYNNKNYEIIQEYQRDYYINKKQERNKNKNNVVIASNKIIISIIED